MRIGWARILLPVSIDHVIDQLLPPYLAETQRVDGADVVQLARAAPGATVAAVLARAAARTAVGPPLLPR